jgi:hypothetical protein
MNITMILSIALAISMGLNALGGWAYLGQRDATVAAEKDRDEAREAATACSDATQDLRDLADTRAKEAAKARQDAAAKARNREELADAILNTSASDADDCKAAAQRATSWLKGRK